MFNIQKIAPYVYEVERNYIQEYVLQIDSCALLYSPKYTMKC